MFFQPADFESTANEYSPMLSIDQWNTSNIYAGAEIRYGYKNIFSFSATGVYRNWDAKDDSQFNAGAYALVYKPAFEADLHIDVHPVSALLLNLWHKSNDTMDIHPEKVILISKKTLLILRKGMVIYLSIGGMAIR